MNKISLIESLTRVVNISGMERKSISKPSVSINRKWLLDLHPYNLIIWYHFQCLSSSVERLFGDIKRYSGTVYHCVTWKSSWWPAGRPRTRRLLGLIKVRAKKSNLEESVFPLCVRMLIFVQQLFYSCTSEVIVPNWLTLMEKLGRREDENDGSTLLVRTVDELSF